MMAYKAIITAQHANVACVRIVEYFISKCAISIQLREVKSVMADKGMHCICICSCIFCTNNFYSVPDNVGWSINKSINQLLKTVPTCWVPDV